jgi:hypothetical protein
VARGKFKQNLRKNRNCELVQASLQGTCRLAKTQHEFLMECERRDHKCAQMLWHPRVLRSNSALVSMLAAKKQGRG